MAALAPVGIFIFIAIIDLQLGIIFLGFALVTLVLPNLFVRWNRTASMARREAYGVLGADFLDAVQGLGTLKAFGQSRAKGRSLAERSRRLYRTTSSITILGISAGAAVALALGADRVSDGELGLRPLLIILMLGVEVFRPLRELVQLYHDGILANSAAEGIFAILDAPVEIQDPDQDGSAPISKVDGKESQPSPSSDNGGSGAWADGQPLFSPEICFEGVSFAYNQGRRPALEQVSFTLRAGESLGLVRPQRRRKVHRGVAPPPLL